MHYFLTGGTGFIGRFLVPKLLQRGGTVYLLVRESSLQKLDDLRKQWGAGPEQVTGVVGELTQPNLGVTDEDIALLRGKVDHFIHLAALYDMNASAERQQLANIEGTRSAVRLAEAMRAKTFHHMSSIAAAGFYKGTFREDMFDEAIRLNDPYLRTKHESERVVRDECQIPWRIYRPGIVIGHSKTGEMDKIDGPYYFFKLLQKVRRALPPWMPLLGIEGGQINIVPVDFVVDAFDHIAHLPGEQGKCFHLTDPQPYRAGEVLNIFADAGHAPRLALRLDSRLLGFIPPMIRQAVTNSPPVKQVTEAVLLDLGIPRTLFDFINYPTRFDCRETERCLKGTGIEVPRLPDYAPVIWDYWERHLDPELHKDATLRSRVEGKVCVVTGASSGIGRAVAVKLAAAGAKVIITARSRENLDVVCAEIKAAGGEVYAYPCDHSDMAASDQLVARVLQDHGQCDVLINNAGRSIRRSLNQSFERFHDFERTMQLNYFGALRLILGFAPGMLERRSGHIINISTLGVLTSAPRFSAYIASKSALDAFTRCAAAEWSDQGVQFTVINMPLVRTPMISPTKAYDSVPALSSEQAAELVMDAIVHRPKRIATKLGVFAQVLSALSPKLSEVILNMGYRMFPERESDEGQGAADAGSEGNAYAHFNEQEALTMLLRSFHW